MASSTTNLGSSLSIEQRRTQASLEQERVRRSMEATKKRWMAGSETRGIGSSAPPMPQQSSVARAANALLDLQPSRRLPPPINIASDSSTSSTSQNQQQQQQKAAAVRSAVPRRIYRAQDYPVETHSMWNRASVMLDTFVFLYNTLDSLHVQMEPGLWSKVYALPPMRDRRLNWSRLDEARHMQFLPRHQDPTTNGGDSHVFPVAELDESEFDEGRATVTRVGVKRRHERGSAALCNLPVYARKNGLFDPPSTVYDEALRRSFVQQNDGFLCGTHGLNNLMNRIAFAPADMLGIIDEFRPLGTMYAQLEEVTLAALREGVFMLQVSLTSLSELTPLHDTEKYPERKTFLRLLKRAGGMLVYRPTANGHFVTLTYRNDEGDDELKPLPAGGAGSTQRWAIWTASVWWCAARRRRRCSRGTSLRRASSASPIRA